MRIIFLNLRENFLILLVATIISGYLGYKFMPEKQDTTVYEGYLFITPTYDGYGNFRNPKPPLDQLTKNLTEDIVFAKDLVELIKNERPELLMIEDSVTLYHKIKEMIDIKRVGTGIYMVKVVGDLNLYRDSMDLFKENIERIYRKTTLEYVDGFRDPKSTCYYFDRLCSNLLEPYLELISIVENRGLYQESKYMTVYYANNNKVRYGLFSLFMLSGFSIVYISTLYRRLFGDLDESRVTS
ncbi:hypothetical protein A1QW_04710 [Vibrio anguillarum]|uniref:Uncharacterized protein n=2 Tax=Vibrionaceae TaxID=641 RepID=A0A853R3S3_9VIBR|nr:hypothetical protein [Vibrio sp. A14(2019)]MDQ2197068.1 hypothetical protein [Vibrio sp. 2017_1457_11]NNN76227.1 hypothetical protein [Vibrio sp. B7]NNN92818.1 hypothetical protein [Vibrio sp. B8-1]NNO08331.1 hypothetical protein [Vibrio sp. B4-12]OEE34052.1 hypothetical protein A1QS_07110 [Vibrio ordalii FS-238]OEE39773.1 hypothetical protein A1QW_04710 [Vibrio anguillarum]